MLKGFAAFAAIMFFSLSQSGYAAMFLVIAVILTAAALFGIDLKEMFVSLRRIWLLLFIVAIVQGFRDGDFVFSSALEGIARILGVFFIAGLYVNISPQSELMYFWEMCFRPFALFGLPARELALVMVIAVRFLPVMLNEIERIRMAQIARGARLADGGIIASAAALMPLMIPTLTQAIIRAGDLAQAMEARGYSLSASRSRYYPFRFSCIDYFALFLLIAATVIAIFARP
jgi:energy-coupling factor transport system permease protein